MDRRDFARQLAAGAALGAVPAWAQPPVRPKPATPPTPAADHDMAVMTRFVDTLAGGDPAERARIVPARPRQVALVAYPGFFPLDLLGTKAVFDDLLMTEVHIVAKDRTPIAAGRHVQLVPNHTFESCPAELDVLFVPGGGAGTVAAMQDEALLAFLRRQAERARFVTSVCTGALVLGAAGLLRGYRATTHWVTHEVLADFGAIPVTERVVQDRNRITGGGVTAGIDFGLTIAAQLAGETYARAVQLNIEYAPAPPFAAGTPEGAGPRVSGAMREMYADLVAGSRAVAARAGAR
jgi:cyclohexyl-isocyanide hydratase